MPSGSRTGKDDDEVLVRYKFKDMQEISEMRCTYLQYMNLKDLPMTKFCEIVKE